MKKLIILVTAILLTATPAYCLSANVIYNQCKYIKKEWLSEEESVKVNFCYGYMLGYQEGAMWGGTFTHQYCIPEDVTAFDLAEVFVDRVSGWSDEAREDMSFFLVLADGLKKKYPCSE
jgi:hypothetical protein